MGYAPDTMSVFPVVLGPNDRTKGKETPVYGLGYASRPKVGVTKTSPIGNPKILTSIDVMWEPTMVKMRRRAENHDKQAQKWCDRYGVRFTPNGAKAA